MGEKNEQVRYVGTFHDLSKAEQQISGGKGKTLVRLFKRNYPVPDGLVIMPTAFAEDELSGEAWAQIKPLVRCLRRKGDAFAVRSSALGEDSARTSFAGQFETVLDVHDDNQILSAIRTVRQSRDLKRVRNYMHSRGVRTVPDMAVVVQLMVPADVSGVLFTANPVDGSRTRMVGNFVQGLGERLVGGEANARSFSMERTKGKYEGSAELQPFARRLYKLATRLENELGIPQDIEWAVTGNKLYILQSRPVTTLLGWDPVTGESNDSLTGDYGWSSVNLGEAAAGVMTPLTLSVWRVLANQLEVIPGYLPFGNIGGRVYLNSTVSAHMMIILHMNVKERAREFGGISEEILDTFLRTLTPLPGAGRLQIIFKAFKFALKQRSALRHLSSFVAGNPAWCSSMSARINGISSINDLMSLYKLQLEPRFVSSFLKVWSSGTQHTGYTGGLRHELTRLADAGDADTLLSDVSRRTEMLASLGPTVGLSRMARGKMSREAYLERWGHRSELEGELSSPRPYEDPEWLDKRFADFSRHPVDVDAMLVAQQAEFEEAWERFKKRHPRKVKSMRRRLDRAAHYARIRETVRSECVRIFSVMRSWVLRVAALTGIGEDIFFLTRDELLDILVGRYVNRAYLPTRQETYERYKRLPCYPGFIKGRFDPFKWAADPNRRNDIFDSSGQLSTIPELLDNGDAIVGMPGASGDAEGLVRRIDNLQEGDKLKQGEILVTSTTNIGWTLLFPRARAIVTDIGAPLSHAAIVARELGVPAVVNCRNATQRLHTGDRVRVNGTKGLIEILERKNSKITQ